MVTFDRKIRYQDVFDWVLLDVTPAQTGFCEVPLSDAFGDWMTQACLCKRGSGVAISRYNYLLATKNCNLRTRSR